MFRSGYISTGDCYRASDSITGCLLDIRGKNPRPFLVLDRSGFWASRLGAYCLTSRVRRKDVAYVMRFSFRELFTCLLRFPNFATALLACEYRGYDITARILLEYPFLQRYTSPISFGDIKCPPTTFD
ncbi:hypothetical protein [Microvirus mar41]|uniref:Uncharacterized protein n=2 Tax=unclassified Microviridae TaxID=117574 RepID=A0A8F5MLN6_9VIRU|nr:hypothetical protein [Microvirus mar41]QXN75208.1 hypothetical protein [Microvirus mar42]